MWSSNQYHVCVSELFWVRMWVGEWTHWWRYLVWTTVGAPRAKRPSPALFRGQTCKNIQRVFVTWGNPQKRDQLLRPEDVSGTSMDILGNKEICVKYWEAKPNKVQVVPHFVQLCLIIPPITEEVTVPTPNHCHSLNTSRTWTVNHRPSISQH